MTEQLPFLQRVGVREIDQTIKDVRLAETGVEFHYVVDTFEISNFCFPANAHIYQATIPSLDQIADDQIALFEIFYGHKNKPILLHEYVYELQSLIMGIERSIRMGSGILDDLIRGARLEDLFFDREHTSKEVVMDRIVASHFSLILALAMGLHLDGVARLSDLYKKRLITEAFGGGEDREVIQEAFYKNRGSGLAHDIHDSLSSEIDRSNHKPVFKEKRKQTAWSDAYAVDRLISINKFMANCLAENRVSRRHLFLYLSSARRSQMIFKLPFVESELDRFDGVRFSPLRTRSHLLLQAISREDDIDKTISNLRRLRDLVEKRSPGDDTSEDSELTRKTDIVSAQYQAQIAKHNTKIKNYGLAAVYSKLEKYKELAAFESDHATLDIGEMEDVLEEVLTDPEYSSIAEAHRDINIFLSEFKTESKKSLLLGLARVGASYAENLPFLRKGRDPVMGTDQHLPTVFGAHDERYEGIISDIISFFKTPLQGDSKKLERIRRACGDFLEIDLAESSLNYEHEFIRCLLFLAVPTPNADQIGLEHAAEMVRILSERSDNEALDSRSSDLLERDFTYLICWAARRHRDYVVGHKWVTKSLEKYKDDPDPRFFHARALNTYSWYKEKSVPTKNVSMKQAIEDAEMAVSLYRREDKVKWSGEIAALLNTLACFYCYELDETVDIDQARSYLDELKDVCDKTLWGDRYPEYFHTEAFVEYKEFCFARNKMSEPFQVPEVEACISKLEHAAREIKRACLMFQAEEYLVLLDQIENSIDNMSKILEKLRPRPPVGVHNP